VEGTGIQSLLDPGVDGKKVSRTFLETVIEGIGK
jgi:hypothetical protein